MKIFKDFRPPDEAAGPRGQAAADEDGPAVCGRQQERCTRCAGDLDRGSAAGHQDGRDQERGATGGAGAAPHAPATGEVPHRPDQRPAGPVGRIRRSYAARPGRGMRRGMACALERVSKRLPAMVVETLREQWARVSRLDAEVGEIERRLKLWHRDNASSRRIAEIPGVGVLSATAAVAAMGDPAARSSLDGSLPPGWALCPGTAAPVGGCACLVSPQAWGDRYLRTLLIHGARSGARHALEWCSPQRSVQRRWPHHGQSPSVGRLSGPAPLAWHCVHEAHRHDVYRTGSQISPPYRLKRI